MDDGNPGDRANYLGTLDELKTVIARQQVTDVVIALPYSAYARMSEIVGCLDELPVGVWIALGFFDYDPGVTSKLLPVAMIALIVALVCAFSAYWLCRLARLPTGESRALLIPTLSLIAITALWMSAAIVAR